MIQWQRYLVRIFCVVACLLVFANAAQALIHSEHDHVAKAVAVHDAVVEFAREAPKVELHVHLDGAYDLDLLLEMVQNKEFQKEFPTDVEANFITGKRINVHDIAANISNRDELRPHVQVAAESKTLAEFLEPFNFFNPVVRVALSHDMTYLSRIAFAFAQRQRESNVLYSEVRFSPHLLSPRVRADKDEHVNVTDLRAVVDMVAAGLSRGQDELGIRINMILCGIDRYPKWTLDIADLVAEYAAKPHDGKSPRVVSMDVAAGESHMDSVDAAWEEVRAKMRGLHDNEKLPDYSRTIAIHAGEDTSDEHVLKAVQEYDAVRIGHGYRLLDGAKNLTASGKVEVPIYTDKILPAFLNRYAAYQDLHFEGCPSSSRRTGGVPFHGTPWSSWAKHPIKVLYQNGFSVGINTDDPSVLGITLASEWELCVAKMGFAPQDMLLMTLRQVESTFLPSDEKEELRRTIERWYQDQQLTGVQRAGGLASASVSAQATVRVMS